MIKRIVSLLIVLNITFSMIYVQADETIAEESGQEDTTQTVTLTTQEKEMISVLAALGIIDYENELDIKWDEPVTRAEAVTIDRKSVV